MPGVASPCLIRAYHTEPKSESEILVLPGSVWPTHQYRGTGNPKP